MSLTDDCAREVVAMHEALQAWFVTGDDDAFDHVEAALAPGFVVVDPGGGETDRDSLLASLGEAGGGRADADPPFEIEIRAVEPRLTSDDLCLVTYEEWQRGGDDAETGRVSSALFRRAESSPGVEWVHLHETWLEGPA